MNNGFHKEDVVDSAHGEAIAETYSDEEVLKGIQDICRDSFGDILPNRMEEKTLVRLTRRIYSRFGCSRAQILRLLPVDEYLLDRIL